MRCAILLLAVLVLTVAPSLTGQEQPLSRIPTRNLWIPLPGVAVIRDSAQWELLWRRFERVRWRSDDGTLIHHPTPPIDFRREMLIAVMMGPTSGCSNEARYIQRIIERADSLVVEIGPQHTGPHVTCMAVIQPVDVVRVSRSAKPVAFHSRWQHGSVPERARWWERPSWAELDRMERRKREVYLLALARDPRSTTQDLREIAARTTDYATASVLVQHPLVQADPLALLPLVRVGDSIGRQARQLLVERHGPQLASDPTTPPATLRVLIEEIDEWRIQDHAELARILLRHPALRTEQDLLRLFTQRVQLDPEVIAEACTLYLARWPAWRRILDAQGNEIAMWGVVLPWCPDRPPPPPPPR